MKDFRAAAVGMCTQAQIKDIPVPICLSHHQRLFMLNVKVRFVLTEESEPKCWIDIASSFVLFVNQSHLVGKENISKLRDVVNSHSDFSQLHT